MSDRYQEELIEQLEKLEQLHTALEQRLAKLEQLHEHTTLGLRCGCTVTTGRGQIPIWLSNTMPSLWITLCKEHRKTEL